MKGAPSKDESPRPGAESSPPSAGLVNGEDLLKVLWPLETSRPTLRWLRSMQERRLVPFKRVSRRIFFDPAEVRAVLDRNCSVEAIGK